MQNQDKEKDLKGNGRDQSAEEPITLDPSEAGETSADLEFYVKTIEELRQERDQYYDQLLRKQAEFENYRKRVNREKDELRATAKIEVLRELLPLLDSAQTGLDSLRELKAGAERQAFVRGYELLVRGITSVLERFGVAPVPGEGEPFDPNLHEAVTREVSDELEEGQILEEFRKGYQMGDRLLRPSQVKVAVHPEEASSLEN